VQPDDFAAAEAQARSDELDATASQEGAMVSSTQASTFRRRIVGASLIAFPLLLGVDAVIDVGNQGTPESLYDEGRNHAGAAIAAGVLIILSSFFLIPAIFGVVHLVRERSFVLGHLGAFFGILGALGHVGFATLLLFLPAIGDGDRTEMVALLDRLEGGAGAVLLPLIVSFGIGFLLLMIGLWRARIAPTWALAAVVVAFGFEMISPGSFLLGQVLKQTLGLAAYGWIGLHVLRMSDADWERPQIGLEASPVAAQAAA
jgi:hypothetical protein